MATKRTSTKKLKAVKRASKRPTNGRSTKKVTAKKASSKKRSSKAPAKKAAGKKRSSKAPAKKRTTKAPASASRDTRPAKRRVRRAKPAVSAVPLPGPAPMPVTVTVSAPAPASATVSGPVSEAPPRAADPGTPTGTASSIPPSYLQGLPQDHVELVSGLLQVVRGAAKDLRMLLAQAISIGQQKNNRHDR
jgi:hypothetical protein